MRSLLVSKMLPLQYSLQIPLPVEKKSARPESMSKSLVTRRATNTGCRSVEAAELLEGTERTIVARISLFD